MPKNGRPTKYDPKYCEQMIAFFDKETFEEVMIVSTGKGDFYKEEPKIMPRKLPTMERFAYEIGVNTDTLLEWSKRHKAFSAAYTRCKELQKNGLVQGGLVGAYASNFAIFVAKNFTTMEDKTKTEHSGKMSLTEFLADETNQPPRTTDGSNNS